MTLYEITQEFMELLEMASEEAIDQDIINDTLEGVEFEFEEKAVSIAKVMKNLEGNVDMFDKEIKRLTDKKKTVQNNISSLKKNLEDSMIKTGKKKFKTDLFSFSIQKNPASVVIDSAEDIPEEYLIQQEPKLDKKSMSGFLKDNKVSWAHLEQGESLRIR